MVLGLSTWNLLASIMSAIRVLDLIQIFSAAAAAAAKPRQSCPTLCDPIDGSPLGSPDPGILQARTLPIKKNPLLNYQLIIFHFSNCSKPNTYQKIYSSSIFYSKLLQAINFQFGPAMISHLLREEINFCCETRAQFLSEVVIGKSSPKYLNWAYMELKLLPLKNELYEVDNKHERYTPAILCLPHKLFPSMSQVKICFHEYNYNWQHRAGDKR